MMKNNDKNFSRELFIPIINFVKNKEFDKALKLLDDISEDHSDIINRFKGSIYLSKKNWQKSLCYYEKMSANEKNFKILNNIGFALFKLGRFYEASKKFKQSIDYNNSFISAYENLSISYKMIGNYDLSIKYILHAINLMPNNQNLKNNLIDTFNYYKPKVYDNSIININYQINKLDVKKSNILIKNPIINNIFEKSEEILKNNHVTFNYPETQIYKKNELNLNCDRHFGIFNKYRIIPKFCFSCYKIQITLNNVLSLIKLYFYFNNLNLKKNNIRKCMIELRENISGNYKGYIYANSIEESQSIKKKIEDDFKDEKSFLKKIEIKHGCTEYYKEYKIYKNIHQDVEDEIYKNEWSDIEKEFDEKNLIIENNKERIYNKTVNEFSLPDYLIIRNWFLYSKLIGDESYKEVFKFDININHLSDIERQKIKSRVKIRSLL